MKKVTSISPRILITIILCISTLAVFGQVCRFDFLDYDDHQAVYENPYLNPVTVPHVLHFWKHPCFSLYMPATYTTWAALATVARLPQPISTIGTDAYSLNPHVFHTANLLVHMLNVLVVFVILRLLVKHDWAAGAGALLFSLHPVQVEPVAWITEMKGVLHGLFALLALWQYLHYAMSASENPGRRRVHYVLATICFIFALLAKPTAVVVPLIAFVLDRWVLSRPTRQSLRPLLPWLAVAVLWIFLTRSAQPIEDKSVLTPFWTRPLIAGDAVTFYLSQLAFPMNLAPHYGRTPERALQGGLIYLTAALPYLLLLAVWRTRRCHLIAASGVFVAALLPVLGFIPFGYQMYSTVADRYLYVAMLAPALGLAWMLARMNKQIVWGLCAIVLVLFGWRSAVQASYWQNTVTLFQQELRVNPQSWVAHTALGAVADRGGKTVNAIQHYRAALHAKPDYLEARNNLGLALAKRGKLREAADEFNTVLRSKPDYADAQINLANVLSKQGKTEEAIAAYHQAVRLQPASSDLQMNFGVVLNQAGQGDAAMAAFKEALQLDPRNAEAHNYLGSALAARGNYAEAVEHFSEALRIKPNYVEAHHNFGGALMLGGNVDGAIAQWYEALRLDPNYAPSREALNALRRARKAPSR